ncbi:cysteine desulfurase family protein [Kamptonema cortianum]|nr:cysteine desulfurase family protein [Geitlerinema splendidum]MDK3160430.1 cysteine desulfurase family protein [Kamptonema cortianum]
MKLENYFDHAATTPVDPEVVEAMMPFLTDKFGNASSIHQWGRDAKVAVFKARQQVADLIGAEDAEQILFTSGSTEGCNTILRAMCGDVWVSPFEHPAVRQPACKLGFNVLRNQGWQLLPPRSADGICVMKVNNETGAILSPRVLPDPFTFSDITQAVGKIPIDASEFDAAVISGHKFYGPKGVGALYVKDPNWLRERECLFMGGGQEYGLRGGTLNVPGIVALGKAAELAIHQQASNYDNACKLRSLFADEMTKISGAAVNQAPSQSPFICSVTFTEVVAQALVVDLDARGFAVSAGSACSSSGESASPTLSALGLSPSEALGTLRISFSKFNTEESTINLARSVQDSVSRLRSRH